MGKPWPCLQSQLTSGTGDTDALPAPLLHHHALPIVRFPCHPSALQVVKIDVEGFEPQVYAGGRQFFGQVQPRFIMAEVRINGLGWALHASPTQA